MTDLNNLIERLRQERWCTVEGDENSEEGAEYWPSNWPHEAADALDAAKAHERAALDAAHVALQAAEAEKRAAVAAKVQEIGDLVLGEGFAGFHDPIRKKLAAAIRALADTDALAERDRPLREVVEAIAKKELPSEVEYPMNVDWRYLYEQMVLKARSVSREEI
jgi:hypothetical protein